jgi:hypothetical protein
MKHGSATYLCLPKKKLHPLHPLQMGLAMLTIRYMTTIRLSHSRIHPESSIEEFNDETPTSQPFHASQCRRKGGGKILGPHWRLPRKMMLIVLRGSSPIVRVVIIANPAKSHCLRFSRPLPLGYSLCGVCAGPPRLSRRHWD